MHIGQRIQIRAFRSDGVCYRAWEATVEELPAGGVVVVTPVGHRVVEIDHGRSSEYAIRAHYWTDRLYSLLEVYNRDETLSQIYVNINGPVEIDGDGLRYVDYELDVSYRPPGPAVVVDQDEFREAAAAFGYSAEFQEVCFDAAREAVHVAEAWLPRGAPRLAAG
jgi:protein associated with RNAse G/E